MFIDLKKILPACFFIPCHDAEHQVHPQTHAKTTPLLLSICLARRNVLEIICKHSFFQQSGFDLNLSHALLAKVVVLLYESPQRLVEIEPCHLYLYRV